MDRITKLKEFLSANPGDAFLQHALALEYIKRGDDAPARRLFEEILAADPTYVGSYYHLAKLLERAGETELAKQWYEKGIEQAADAADLHALRELRAAYDALEDGAG